MQILGFLTTIYKNNGTQIYLIALIFRIRVIRQTCVLFT